MNEKPLMQPNAIGRQAVSAAHAVDSRAAIDRHLWRVIGICLAVAPPLLAFVPVGPTAMELPPAMAVTTSEPATVPAVVLGDSAESPSRPAAP